MGENEGFLSRKHIIEGLNNSLKRLQLDYVDVVFCHRYDMFTPLEETCRAMNWLIEQGKAFYWGTSEWAASQIMHAHAICDRLGLIKPICEQPQYSLLARERFEREYVPLFNDFKLGTTIWSPLFSGVLTGKYINEIPKNSRFDISSDLACKHLAEYNEKKSEIDAKIIKLKAIAESLDATLPQLCIAWVIRNTDVSTCIIGASKPKQIIENLGALNVLKKFTNDVEMKIEEIMGNCPSGEMNWRYYEKLRPRRQILFDIKK